MAGKYSSVTPYNYAFNDPIGLNDPSGADPYLPRYQEDRAARSAAQGGWGGGTIMDQGPIADPQRPAGSYYAAGRPELWGRGRMSNWFTFDPGGYGFNAEGDYGIGPGYGALNGGSIWGNPEKAWQRWEKRMIMRGLLITAWLSTPEDGVSTSRFNNKGEWVTNWSIDWSVHGDGKGNGLILVTYLGAKKNEKITIGEGYDGAKGMKYAMSKSRKKYYEYLIKKYKPEVDLRFASNDPPFNRAMDMVVSLIDPPVYIGTTIIAAIGNGYGKMFSGRHPDFRAYRLTSDKFFVREANMMGEHLSQEEAYRIMKNTSYVMLNIVLIPEIFPNKYWDKGIKFLFELTIDGIIGN